MFLFLLILLLGLKVGKLESRRESRHIAEVHREWHGGHDTNRHGVRIARALPVIPIISTIVVSVFAVVVTTSILA